MESGSAFRYLSSVFADDFALTSSMKLQKVYMVLAHIQLLTQNINFLWNPSIKIAFWSSFIDFWTILNYPCVDSLFASTGEIFTFLILVTSLLTLSVLLILIHLITTFFRKSTPKFILKLLRFIIALICELYFIPSAIVILLLFKYSYVNTDHLEEYTNFPSSKKFNYGTFGMVLSILLLGVLLVITFIREACCFVVRHSMAELHLEAKSSPNADILMKLFSFINCVMFISRQLEGYEIYLVFAAMQYLYCIYKYLYYLPYYSPFVNFVKVLVYFEAFCISLFFLFAFVADNATIAFVLAICMQPVIVLLVKNAIEYRMSKVSKFTQEIKSNLVTFELSARESLNSEENPQILINAMNENFDHNQNKLVYVYLANYCHDKLANPALASVKISLTNYSGFDLIGNFQIYKLQKKFEDCKINNSKALQLCIYLLDSAFNFKLDKRLCKKIKKLCDLILEKNVPLKKLKTAIFYVGQKIEKTVKCYEENIAKYPESRLLQKMLGTLLSDILNTPNIGKTYLDMYESRSSIPKTKKTYSVEDSLILITSGDQKDFGKVLYASKSFCDLLKLKFDNVKDYNLADFIPKVYSETHEKYLYSFIRGSMSTIVSMIFPVFLVDSQGFLIECYIRSECVGCNSQVKFISEITPNQTSLREIAIINAAGYIYCHSQLFPNKIGEDSYKIEGRYLAEILPENCLREFNQEISYTTEFYSFNKKAFISLGYSISSIFQKSANIFVFYLVDDQRQVAKMQRKRNFKVHFQKIRLSFSDQLDRIEANQPKEEDEIEENVKKWEKNQEENKENVLKKLSLDQNMTRILSECNQDENCEKSHNISENISRTYFKETSRSISIFKVTKILLCIMVCVIITYNVILLTYISNEVEYSAGQKVQQHFSELLFSMLKLCLIIQSTDMSYSTNSQYHFKISEISETLVNITDIYENYLLEDYAKWSYCPSSALITENILTIWTQKNSTVSGSLTNLPDVVKSTIFYAKNFAKEFEQETYNYNSDLFYLTANSFRVSEDFMTKAFNGLTQCEKNRVKELDYKIIYVFIGGIVLFGAIFTGIILFLCAVDFNLNILYKKLLMSVQANYNDLDDLVRTRLEAFHNSSKSKSIEKIKLTRKGRNHRHSLRYLFRIFILIALVVIMLTISVLYLYENIRNSLEFRITFMNWMTLRGLSIAKVSYFTMESMKSFYSEFFQNESRNFTFMRDPEVHLNITFDELDIIRKFGFTKYMQDSMPPEVFTLLFTKAEGADFLSIGVNFAFNYARWESYSIIAEKSNFNSTAMEVYLSQATILQDISREIARLSEDLLQAKVQVLMNWLIYSILSSLIIITLILIYFYIPYFNKEQKIAIMIDSLIKMIGTQKN